jgi:hypothetical protein
MDASLTPFNARSMPEQIDQLMFPPRVALRTYGCIGGLGLRYSDRAGCPDHPRA